MTLTLIIISFGIGMLSGVLYFTNLWWSIKCYIKGRGYGWCVFVLNSIRFTLFIAVLLLVLLLGVTALQIIISLAGFVVVRLLMTSLVTSPRCVGEV